ncbi:hypothetical protein KAH55_00170, partial [bacterium]|nr:hypothetical protein [bacterium]
LSHWQEQARSEQEVNRNLGLYWVDALEKGRPLAKAVPWDIGLVQLNARNQLVWMAGEVCAEWLPKLREWLADPGLTALGYCQDLPSYFPTAEMIPEGGYEVDRSNWYRKTGPMPYAQTIDDSARRELLALKRKISSK